MNATVTDLDEARRVRNNANAERWRRKQGMKARVQAGPTKVCPGCKQEKDRANDFYWAVSQGKRKALGYCKVCCAARQRTRDWAKRLVEQVKSRHVKRFTEIFDLTPEHLHKLFEQQNGKCAWLRVTLRVELGGAFRHPNQVSLDRIDCDKGYTKDNVLLVCQAANLARCDAPAEVFEDFVLSIRRT